MLRRFATVALLLSGGGCLSNPPRPGSADGGDMTDGPIVDAGSVADAIVADAMIPAEDPIRTRPVVADLDGDGKDDLVYTYKLPGGGELRIEWGGGAGARDDIDFQGLGPLAAYVGNVIDTPALDIVVLAEADGGSVAKMLTLVGAGSRSFADADVFHAVQVMGSDFTFDPPLAAPAFVEAPDTGGVFFGSPAWILHTDGPPNTTVDAELVRDGTGDTWTDHAVYGAHSVPGPDGDDLLVVMADRTWLLHGSTTQPTGTMRTEVTYGDPIKEKRVAFADLEADGLPDAIVGSEEGQLYYVLTNYNGMGAHAHVEVLLPPVTTTDEIRAVTAGQLDGDPRFDTVILRRTSTLLTYLEVHLNVSDGGGGIMGPSSGSEIYSPMVLDQPYWLVTGDFDATEGPEIRAYDRQGGLHMCYFVADPSTLVSCL